MSYEETALFSSRTSFTQIWKPSRILMEPKVECRLSHSVSKGFFKMLFKGETTTVNSNLNYTLIKAHIIFI